MLFLFNLTETDALLSNGSDGESDVWSALRPDLVDAAYSDTIVIYVNLHNLFILSNVILVLIENNVYVSSHMRYFSYLCHHLSYWLIVSFCSVDNKSDIMLCSQTVFWCI